MCQIFIAVASGTLVIYKQMADTAAASHQHVADVLAVESMFANIGGAIGSTISAAIWYGVFPKRLETYLPGDVKANATITYGDLVQQLSYPVGSPSHEAINLACGDAQRYILTAFSVILVLAVVSVAVWRDIKATDFKQTKGLVIQMALSYFRLRGARLPNETYMASFLDPKSANSIKLLACFFSSWKKSDPLSCESRSGRNL